MAFNVNHLQAGTSHEMAFLVWILKARIKFKMSSAAIFSGLLINNSEDVA